MTDRTTGPTPGRSLPIPLRSLARDRAFTAPVLATLALVAALLLVAAALMRPVSAWPPAVAPTFGAEPLASWSWDAAFTAAAESPAAVQAQGLAMLVLGLAGVLATVVALALVALITLFAGRAAHRARDRATRAALGATPLRLAARGAADAVFLGVAAAALGLPLGLAGLALLAATWPPGLAAPDLSPIASRLSPLAPHPSPLALLPAPAGWAIALTGPALLALLAAGLGVLLTPPAGPADLRAGARATRPTRAGRPLLVGQIGISLALLTAAAAPLLHRAPERDAGYDPAGRVVSVAAMTRGEADAARRAATYRAIAERLRGLGGIDGVALASPGAWLGLGPRDRVLGDCGGCSIGGLLIPFTASRPRLHVVSPDSFQVLGIPVLAGREFTWDDDADAEPVAIVSRTFIADRLLGNEPVIGKRIQLGEPTDPWYRVVGVVDDVAPTGPGSADGEPAVYLPLLQHPPRSATLTLASPLDPATLTRLVDAALAELDPAPVSLAPLTPLADRLARFAAPVRWLATLVATVAGLALLLAAHGTRAAMRHAVERRRREIGTRIALGARPRHIIARILGASLRIALAGGAVGLVIAVTHPGARAALDPALFGGLAAVLGTMGVVGGLGAAIRAVRVEPAEALRGE